MSLYNDGFDWNQYKSPVGDETVYDEGGFTMDIPEGEQKIFSDFLENMMCMIRTGTNDRSIMLSTYYKDGRKEVKFYETD